jgi:hypothetical protein
MDRNIGNIHIPQWKKRGNVFYTVKNGNYTDLSIWASNGLKARKSPGSNDTVIINHTVTLTTNLNITLNSLYVYGSFTVTGGVFTTFLINNFFLLGDTGTINTSSISGIFASFTINGPYNYSQIPSNFITGTGSIRYGGNLDQPVLNLNYYDLGFYTAFTRYLISNIVVSNSFNSVLNSILDARGYTFTVNGTSSNGIITSSVSGCYILFKGAVTNLGSAYFNSGDTTSVVEFQNGISFVANVANTVPINGQLKFTTNNQTLTANGWNQGDSTVTVNGITTSGDYVYLIGSPILIDNGITVTLNGSIKVFSSLEGGNSSSKLLMGASSCLIIINPTGRVMTTGIFDCTTNSNTIVNYESGNRNTIDFTTYNYLVISGVTRLLKGNTTINNDLQNTTLYYYYTNCVVNTNGYNLTIKGNHYIYGFITLGSEYITTIGVCAIMNTLGYSAGLLSINAATTFEFRGDLQFNNSCYTNLFSLCNLKFTTNNQSLKFLYINLGNITLNNVTIGSGVALTYNWSLTNGGGFIIINGGLNGTDGTSSFVIASGINSSTPNYLYYKATQQPMLTGTFNASATWTTVNYNGGNQNIAPTTYYNLIFTSSGGIVTKTIVGNIICTTYTKNANVNISNPGGYTLTVNGTITPF